MVSKFAKITAQIPFFPSYWERKLRKYPHFPDWSDAKEGLSLDDHQKVQIEIFWSIFDGKISSFLTDAGGANCQLCTTTWS